MHRIDRRTIFFHQSEFWGLSKFTQNCGDNCVKKPQIN